MVSASLLVFGGIGAIAKAASRTATAPAPLAAQQAQGNVQGNNPEKVDNASESQYGAVDEKADGPEQPDANEAENLPRGGHADQEGAGVDHQSEGVE